MILHRQQFSIAEKCVIEKLIISTPFRYGAIFQNEACFLYFKDGSTVISSSTEKLQLIARESVLLKCGNYFADFIQQISSETIEIYVIHLYSALLEELYKNEIPSFIKEKQTSNYAHKVPNNSVINHFIDSLIFYFENPALVNRDLLELKIKELILLLLQTKNATSVLDLFSTLFSPRQANIKEVIQTHLYSNLSVNELAVLCGLSISSFKREFQLVFNDSPANYIRIHKLQKACELLKHSDFSVGEICFQTGFNNVSHFTRAFKVFSQQSPLEFRKEKKNK